MSRLLTLFLVLSFNIYDCNLQQSFNYKEEGIASYYHDVLEGNLTANGEVFSQDSLTAAHRTLPFGTKVLVTRPENNKKVWVIINDRGPFNYNRIIDLSKRAADSLGLVTKGITEVIIKANVSEEFLSGIEIKE